jgi:hypothetical protein
MKTYGGNGGMSSRILNLTVNKGALPASRSVRLYSQYLNVIRLGRQEAVEKIYLSTDNRTHVPRSSSQQSNYYNDESIILKLLVN